MDALEHREKIVAKDDCVHQNKDTNYIGKLLKFLTLFLESHMSITRSGATNKVPAAF